MVKLRGRARKITFHVFDPRHIEDVLDRDMPAPVDVGGQNGKDGDDLLEPRTPAAASLVSGRLSPGRGCLTVR